jgi:hypothetical protein
LNARVLACRMRGLRPHRRCLGARLARREPFDSEVSQTAALRFEPEHDAIVVLPAENCGAVEAARHVANHAGERMCAVGPTGESVERRLVACAIRFVYRAAAGCSRCQGSSRWGMLHGADPRSSAPAV